MIERMELVFGLGGIAITVIFFAALAVVCFVISSKKKETNPNDSKTWKTLGIILVCIGGVAILGTVAAFVVPMLLSPASSAAVFIM